MSLSAYHGEKEIRLILYFQIKTKGSDPHGEQKRHFKPILFSHSLLCFSFVWLRME
jgi:hypothetical protein